MILSFLGKGGTGKTSLATQMTLFLQKKQSVLAIDADHNMDLVFNLTRDDLPDDFSYLGTALDDALGQVGLTSEDKYTKAFLEEVSARFSFPKSSDSFSDKYTKEIDDNLHIMATGPQTDRVLHGQSCSHYLSTPLKLYLPLLEFTDEAAVVVDEKAGADGASTGIVSGVDVGVVVSEPSLHGVKTANQIAELLKFFDTPHVFVGNKVETEEDRAFLCESLDKEPLVYFENNSNIKRDPFAKSDNWESGLKDIYMKSQKLNNNDRLSRTINKFERNVEFSG